MALAAMPDEMPKILKLETERIKTMLNIKFQGKTTSARIEEIISAYPYASWEIGRHNGTVFIDGYNRPSMKFIAGLLSIGKKLMFAQSEHHKPLYSAERISA